MRNADGQKLKERRRKPAGSKNWGLDKSSIVSNANAKWSRGFTGRLNNFMFLGIAVHSKHGVGLKSSARIIEMFAVIINIR